MNRRLSSYRVSFIVVVTLTLLLTSFTCQEEPALLPGELPEGTVGEPYQVTFTLRGQNSPVHRFRVAEGSLPDGLRLLPRTEDRTAESEESMGLRIEGTPAEDGTFTFILAVSTFGTQQHGISLQQQYELTIHPEN